LLDGDKINVEITVLTLWFGTC